MEKLSKLAIVPDVHGTQFWKEAKEKIDSLDKIIFLGDYLDSYSISGLFNRKGELKNFEEILEFKKTFPEKVTLLLGNHDIGYLFELGCSRQTHGEMYKKYNSLFYENIKLFKITEYIELKNDKILFSHAGITHNWANLFKKRLESNLSVKSEIINWQLNTGIQSSDEGLCFDNQLVINGLFNMLLFNLDNLDINNFLKSIFWTVAPIRGGSSFGSILWADSTEWEDEVNIFGKDIKQIVGHNRMFFPVEMTEGVRCVDTMEPHVFYIEE